MMMMMMMKIIEADSQRGLEKFVVRDGTPDQNTRE